MLARHECADAISREFALGLLVKPLHLRHQSFERPLFFAISGETHFDRRAVRSEIERALKWLGQILEWHVFVDAEMLHERALQLFIICAHPFGPAAPRGDRAFGNRFRLVRNHQLGIDHELRSQTVTRRTGAEMAVERKMFRRQLAQSESRLRIAIVSRETLFFPLFKLGVGRWTLDVERFLLFQDRQLISSPLQRSLD